MVRIGLMLVVAVVTALVARTAFAADPVIGDPAPALALPGLDGKTVTLPAGRVVAVDFFATWCGPCHEAIADLAAATRPLGDRVALVIVDVREDEATVSAFLAAHPGFLPAGALLVLDRGGEAARRWGQHRFPTTFFVDGGGVLRHINRGHGSGYRARVGYWLRAMAGAPKKGE